MHYRQFGNTDFSTSEIGFGCARIGGVFQGSSRADILRLLRRAFESGITFFDTADMYTQGESERLVGEAFRDRRDRVIIATKFGYHLPAQKQLVTRLKPMLKPLVARLGLKPRQVHATLRGAVSQQDFSPEYIRRAVEDSLQRLQTDYIDVYQLHDPPVDVLERGEFVSALDDLRQQGKIRTWGVACKEPADALVSMRDARLGAIQVGLSVLEQAALDETIPRAAELKTAVIARQVFASGWLTRAVDQINLADIDADPEVAVRKRDQIARFDAIAQRCGRTRTDMALQFSLATPGVSVVLLGISRSDQLESGLQALSAPALSPEERELLLGTRRVGR